MLSPYYFTVKRNKHEKSAEDYLWACKSWLVDFQKRGADVVDWTIEHDSKGKPHIHGTAYLKSNCYLKRFMHSGYKVDIHPFKDMESMVRWTSYIHKQSQNKYAILQRNDEYDFSRYGYAFLEEEQDI